MHKSRKQHNATPIVPLHSPSVRSPYHIPLNLVVYDLCPFYMLQMVQNTWGDPGIVLTDMIQSLRNLNT